MTLSESDESLIETIMGRHGYRSDATREFARELTRAFRYREGEALAPESAPESAPEAGLKEGQRVTVTYTGTLVHVLSSTVHVMDGNYQRSHKRAEVTIAPAEPENWPPRPGDLWEAQGHRYFAQLSSDRAKVVLVPADCDRQAYFENAGSAAAGYANFLRLDPELKCR